MVEKHLPSTVSMLQHGSAKTITKGIGSRGCPNLNDMKEVLQMLKKLLTELTKLVILGSHFIWCTRNSITLKFTLSKTVSGDFSDQIP